MPRLWQLKDQSVVEGRSSTSALMTCFLLCYSLSKRTPSATGSQYGASTAPMTGSSSSHIGDESCTDRLIVISGALQNYENIGLKWDSQRSLRNKIYFECNGVDAAADADMNTVPMMSTG